MATLVKHIPTDKKYILIGTGFGAYKASNNVFIANHIPREQEKEMTMASVCDAKGNIHWFSTQDIVILEINGEGPENILQE